MRWRALAFAMVVGLSAGVGRADEPVWLCKPGIANNPCDVSFDTTIVSPAGAVRRVRHITPARHPKSDCFYVYPTVSDQPTGNATLNVDPEERSIALYQAARYAQYCRVFAPMYRQVTIAALFNPALGADREVAYADVLNAWNSYLQNDNDGRGVVLIGHSQGTFVLRKLIAEQIDPNPDVRAKIVSAILLGGNVAVAHGQDAGGDFQNMPACRSPRRIGCVIAFSTFNAPVPAATLFGHADAGRDVLCTNPASLRRNRAAPLTSIMPSAPFAPGTIIGTATLAVGFTLPQVSTTWISVEGGYDGQCSSADDADVLQVAAAHGAPMLHAVPDATWGLHLVDANIALGDLTTLVQQQASVFVRKRHCRFRKASGWGNCGS